MDQSRARERAQAVITATAFMPMLAFGVLVILGVSAVIAFGVAVVFANLTAQIAVQLLDWPDDSGQREHPELPKDPDDQGPQLPPSAGPTAP